MGDVVARRRPNVLSESLLAEIDRLRVQLLTAREDYQLVNKRVIELLTERIDLCEKLFEAERRLAAAGSLLEAEQRHSAEQHARYHKVLANLVGTNEALALLQEKCTSVEGQVVTS